MAVYMVERDLKGISMEDLGAAQKAAIAKAGDMSGQGLSSPAFARSSRRRTGAACAFSTGRAPSRCRRSTTRRDCPTRASSRRSILRRDRLRNLYLPEWPP